MKLKRAHLITTVMLLALASASAEQGQQMQGNHMQHMQMQGAQMQMKGQSDAGQQPAAERNDTRQPVLFPEKIRAHELWSMRDHLKTLQKIQQFLANEAFDEAAEIAEQRLGMSSFELHGAHQSGPYMPPGMQAAGGAMHRSASRFARIATDAAVTGEVRESLAALAELTAKCVACHDGYRLQ